VLFLFLIDHSFAQDTLKRRNRLTDSVIEHFFVLKSNPAVRQGPYQAVFRRKTTIATGEFSNGQKIGIWSFYSPSGVLIEKFNYDTNDFLFEGSLEKGSDITFKFDEKIMINDTVTRPVKIGGSYFGYIPLINVFGLPFDASEVDGDKFSVFVELLISPKGRLADYKVHINSNAYRYFQTTSFNLSLIPEEDKQFLPATLNKKTHFIPCIHQMCDQQRQRDRLLLTIPFAWHARGHRFDSDIIHCLFF